MHNSKTAAGARPTGSGMRVSPAGVPCLFRSLPQMPLHVTGGGSGSSSIKIGCQWCKFVRRALCYQSHRRGGGGGCTARNGCWCQVDRLWDGGVTGWRALLVQVLAAATPVCQIRVHGGASTGEGVA